VKNWGPGSDDDTIESSDQWHEKWTATTDLWAVHMYDGFDAQEDIIIHFKNKDVAKEYYTWVSEKVKKWQKMEEMNGDQTIKTIRIKKGEQMRLAAQNSGATGVVFAESFEEAKAMEWTFLEQIDQDME
jgi:hypothetical protein